jgi:leader peptidase (prepilin peptidase) / N-methyltransferase
VSLLRPELKMKSMLWAMALMAAYGALAGLIGTIWTAGPEFLLRTALLGTALVWLSIIDIETYRLPDWLTLPLAVAGCMFPPDFTPPVIAWHVASAIAGFLSLYLVAWSFQRYRGYGGLGLGDAKLFAAAGAWLGMEALPFVLLVASVLALVLALVAHMAGVAIDRQTRLPFGPFLAIGFWTLWLMGPAPGIGWG